MMFILLFLCGCESKNNNVEKNITEQVTTIKVDESASEETSIKSENTTTTKKTTTSTKNESTTSNNNNQETTKKTTSTTTKKTNTTKKENNSTPYFDKYDNLPVCSDNDPGVKKKIQSIQKNMPSYSLFYTLKDAKAYGEYAMNLGYGYWYSKAPYAVYEGENCYKELYYVQLYQPAKECQDVNGNWNKTMYIPATSKEKLIGNISYLRSKGYVCEGKSDMSVK